MGTLPTRRWSIDTRSRSVSVVDVTSMTVDRPRGRSDAGPAETRRRGVDAGGRRGWRVLLAVVMLLTAVGPVLVGATPAGAEAATGAMTRQDGRAGCGPDGCVDVVAVEGIIDEVVTAFVLDSIARANATGDVVAVVLQVDSPGVAVSHERFTELADAIENSRVPVSVWVGASGAQAVGGAAELVLAADSTGIAPGAFVGRIGAIRSDPDRLGDAASLLVKRVYSGQGAVDAGVIDSFDPTLVDHIGSLEWVDTKVEKVDGREQRSPVPRVRLSKLPLPVQMMHTAASPSVAYLLLISGLGLLLFEFFTAGVGVAGVVGAAFVLLGGFGLGELPFRGWALVLMVGSFVAFAIDMQTGLARLWTWVGYVGFVVSSFFLFDGFGPTWPAMVVGIGGMAAFSFRGMPSMNRARFGTPYVGREWLVGESGVVTEALDPVGLIRLRDAEWTTRSADGTTCPVGAEVVVTGSDRMTLEAVVEGSGDDT